MASKGNPKAEIRYNKKMMSEFQKSLQETPPDKSIQPFSQPKFSNPKLAKENLPYDEKMMAEFADWVKKNPPVVYAAIPQTHLVHDLIFVEVQLQLIDNEEDVLCTINDVALWDTGAASSKMSRGKIPEGTDLSTIVQIEGTDDLNAFFQVTFVGSSTIIPCPFIITPQANMPNNSNWIIFGQRSFVDSIQFRLRGNSFAESPNTLTLMRYMDRLILMVKLISIHNTDY